MASEKITAIVEEIKSLTIHYTQIRSDYSIIMTT